MRRARWRQSTLLFPFKKEPDMTVEKKKERKREAYIILAIATVDGIITSRKELESKEERGKKQIL